MKFFAFFSVFLWCTDAARIDTDPTPSCDAVLPFFHAKNVTFKAAMTSQKGRICGGHCCDDDLELQLQSQGQRDLADLLRHNSRSLLGPLNRTSILLQTHLRDLVDHSEARTLHLFGQIYGAASPTRPIERLYADLRDHVTAEAAPAAPPAISVERFFAALFPLVYRAKAPDHRGEFAANYARCLAAHLDVIQPFAAHPTTIARQLGAAVATARQLIGALRVGVAVLTQAADHVTTQRDHDECHVALVALMSCGKCRALRAKPCAGFCLNVLRGCLSRYAADLDLPWSSYVEGVEGLVGVYRREGSVEGTIKGLHTQISEAVMHFLNKIVEIDHKVRMYCKTPEYAAKTEEAGAANATRARPTPSRYFPHFPDAQVSTLLSILSKTRGFYGELADNLCGDDTFADQRDKKCWNGERVGEYTKTVIGTAANAQMYNPEVKPAVHQHDSKMAALVDQLRHVHHVAVTSVGQSYVEGMQRDGTDGSGSGNGPDIDDDDDEPLRGSGSGNGQEEERPFEATVDVVAPQRPTGNAAAAPATSLALLASLILTFVT